MAKPRILVTTSTYPLWPGDSRTPFIAQFTSHLAGRGWQVIVLAPHAKGARTSEQNNNVNVRRYRYFWPASGETLAYGGGAVTKIKKTPGYAIKLLLMMTSLFLHTVWLALTRRVDYINAHWLIPQGFIAIIAGRLTHKKVVVSVHGSDIFGFNGKWMRKIKTFTLKRADRVVVNSSATLQACRDIYDRADYAVIPMGIDMERFKPREPSAVLRQRYSLGRFTILFVGRMIEVKGVHYLLEALTKLKADGADFKALLVGDGPDKEALEAYAESQHLHEAIFCGWIDANDLPAYYSVADIFVGPSITSDAGWREALGVVIAEALASGVPVLATKSGGIVDVVEDGVTGVLVPERSAEAIAERLRELYDHPGKLKQFSANANQSVRAKFSWGSVLERYEQLFQQL